mgnify:CR=1 FL=1
MTVINRMFFMIGIALTGMVGIGAIGLREMDRVRDSASYAIVNSVPSYDVLDETLQYLVAAIGYVSRHVLSADKATKAKLEKQFEALWPKILATLEKYEPLISNHHDRELLDTDRALLAAYAVQCRTLFALSNAGRREEAQRLLLGTLATVDRITDAFQIHRKYNHALAVAGGEEAQRIHGQATWIIAGITLLIVAFNGIVAHVVIRTLVKQLGGEPEYASEIAGRIAAGDLDVKIDTRPDDQTSLLMAMKEMRDSLRTAQIELVSTSRQAGMAEIATNVLHNVGNVLNSVNISAGVLGNHVRNSKVAGLARVVQMMDEHAADLGNFLSRDEKGKLLPDYLAKLAGALTTEHESILEELGHITKSVEHIKDIVATQQAYAGESRTAEPVRVRELVDDALRMNAGSLARHDVTVVKEIAELSPLPLDRHRVLQILVNLIGNARQAMDGVTGRTHRLTLRANLVDGADGRSLRVCIADDGDGIPAENLTRIFAHGFTTRKGGHGFGLHSCALAAREMGGTLTAHSDGPGQGASFTLELPLNTERIAA